MDQALNSQKSPHTSPLRASYGMSFVSILMKNDRVIKGFYCILNWDQSWSIYLASFLSKLNFLRHLICIQLYTSINWFCYAMFISNRQYLYCITLKQMSYRPSGIISFVHYNLWVFILKALSLEQRTGRWLNIMSKLSLTVTLQHLPWHCLSDTIYLCADI